MASELARVVAEALHISEEEADTPGLAFERLPNWDSMAHIELIVSLEDRFQIELSQDDINAIRGMDDVRAILARNGRI